MKEISMCGSLEELFDRWQEAQRDEKDTDYSKYGNICVRKEFFLPDGVVDDERFKQSQSHVLFIGKESNCSQKEQHESDYNKEECIEEFWLRRVAVFQGKPSILSHRLAMLSRAIQKNDYQTISKDQGHLRDIAFLNLNKRGGLKISEHKTLKGYVCKYSEYIRREIELIDPGIIVCCGKETEKLVKSYVLKQSDKRMISIYHPSYYKIADAEYLRQLQCEVEGMANSAD